MNEHSIRVLLVDSDPKAAAAIQKILTPDADDGHFHVTPVDSLEKAAEFLKGKGADAILLDLSLSEVRSLNTPNQLKKNFPEIPVIILSSVDDEEAAVASVQKGAQDYLVKDQLERNLLIRSIRYAIERHRTEMMLRDLALLDELTGLYNRRGFNMLFDQHLALAQRKKRKMLLILLDINNFKAINDKCGHAAGDQALQTAAGVLKKAFRSSDVVARIGGDEFAVISIEYESAVIDRILKRIGAGLKECNQGIREYKISFAVGYSLYDPAHPAETKALFEDADRMLYQDKALQKSVVTMGLATRK